MDKKPLSCHSGCFLTSRIHFTDISFYLKQKTNHFLCAVRECCQVTQDLSSGRVRNTESRVELIGLIINV